MATGNSDRASVRLGSKQVVNNPKAYTHHPHAERFLYRNIDGSLEFYDDKIHGPNLWAPEISGEDVDTPTAVEAALEASISLERDIEDFLVRDLSAIEAGLTFLERQHETEIGRVDILARDRQGGTVVIEVRAVEARDAAIGQTARYIGWLRAHGHEGVRGILVAPDFADGARYAASAVPGLDLRRCRIHFTFETVTINQEGAPEGASARWSRAREED
jgi:hypothetical protein